MLSRGSVGLVVLCLASAAPALAQMPKVEFTPYAGALLPLSNVIEETGSEAKHDVGVAFGGRVTVWLPASNVGIEGTGAYALSDLELTSLPGSSTADANVALAGAKILFRVQPPTGIASFHFGAGPALVIRGGDAYTGTEGTTDFGGLANVGASFKVGPFIGVRIDVEDYISSAKFSDGAGTETNSKFQNDLVVSGGVLISVGK
jgi:hypothetical protein